MRRPLAAIFLGLVVCAESEGQVVTGVLDGTVEDSSGAVVVNAHVIVASPALLGGSASGITNEEGRFRFPALPPGDYALTVEADGFEPHREPGVRLVVGRTVRKRIVLALAGVEESLTVTAGADLVDPGKISGSTVYGPELVDNLPRQRVDFVDFLKIAPGMSPARPQMGGIPDTSALGSGTDENLFVVDGADMTDPGNGIDPPFVGADQIESVEILRSGASAEYGNYQGAVIHVLTRRGASDWGFHSAYFHQSSALTGGSRTLPCLCPAGESGFDRNQGHELTVGAGGPMAADKLWFYGGYELRRSETSRPGEDPRFPFTSQESRLSLKLDWRITPKLGAWFGLQGGSQSVPPVPTPESPLETQAYWKLRAPSVSFAHVTYTASPSTRFDARASGLFRSQVYEPVLDSVPGHWDVATGVSSGGAEWVDRDTSTRLPVAASVTHYADDFLGAGHELKFGIQFDSSAEVRTHAYPTGVDYFDYDGAPYLAFYSGPTTAAGEVSTTSLFGEDVVAIGARGTLHLGLRFDRNASTSQDVPVIDDKLKPLGGDVTGLGEVYSWTTLSPRLGATFALTRDGRTLLRGSFGRYFRASFAGELAQFHPANGPRTTARWDPATGGYSDVVDVFDPLEDIRLDRGLRPIRTDQLSIGLDRQLSEKAVLGIEYVRKFQRDFSGWADVTGVYGEKVLALPDVREITVFPLESAPSDQRFLLTNRSDFHADYNGLLVTFQGRWPGRWQTLLSYTLSRSTGVTPTSSSNPGASQISSGGFLGTRRVADPNRLINAEGPLSNDRTHMLRAQAFGEIPGVGLLVGVSFQYLTGAPWAAAYRTRLPQTVIPIYIEPQGSRRLPSQTLLDLRLSKIFRFRGDGQLELLVDVFNALDQETAQSVNQFYFTPAFGGERSFIEPLRARLGVKIAF